MNTKETRREIKGVRKFYVDRLCGCGGSRLIKQGKQFIIVNTDSIYRFYK